MHITVQHTRLFRAVYICPQQGYVNTGVIVSIKHRLAVVTSKYLALSIAYVQTFVALLACIVRCNSNQLNPCNRRFVGQKLAQLIKVPFANSCSKLLAFFVSGKANAFEFLNSNAFPFQFGNRNNLLTNSVVNNCACRSLFSRKPFQNAFCIFCAFGLKRTSYFLSFFSISGKFFRTKCFAVAKGCDFQKPHINTDKFLHIFHIFFNHINCLKKVKLTFSKKQVCFAFDVRKIVRVVADKRHFQPAANRPDGNNVVGFVGQDATIIRDRAKWFESPFNLLIQLVGISHFRYAPYDYLTAQLRSTLNGMVAGIMQLKLLKGFLLPSYVGNKITSLVRLFNRLKQTFSLFIGGQQLYFQREFHNANIQLFQVQENILFALKALGVVAYIPPTLRDEWVSRSFL